MRHLIVAASLAFVAGAPLRAPGAEPTPQAFDREVERLLPVEKAYTFHRHLETMPLHVARRAPASKKAADEMAIPERGWTIVWNPKDGDLVRRAFCSQETAACASAFPCRRELLFASNR